MSRATDKHFATGLLAALIVGVAAADEITFTPQGQTATRSVDAEVLVEAADGGLMIRLRDGQLLLLQPGQIVARTAAPVGEMFGHDALAASVLAELPTGMSAHQTEHYVVIYRGDLDYARRVATLFETLHRAFFAFWENQKVPVEPPGSPLVAVIWPDAASYAAHAAEQVGPGSGSMIGYYHLMTNRMVTYRIEDIERSVATLVHEATHQLAFNCSLQTRLADNPLWVSEGLAMFFESPDLASSRGWRGVGRVNVVNLRRYRAGIGRRAEDSLQNLIATDAPFADPSAAGDAYGQSWALTYFLIRTRRDDYLRYLQTLSSNLPLRSSDGRARLQAFQEAFGPIDQLEAAFRRYMLKVRG